MTVQVFNRNYFKNPLPKLLFSIAFSCQIYILSFLQELKVPCIAFTSSKIFPTLTLQVNFQGGEKNGLGPGAPQSQASTSNDCNLRCTIEMQHIRMWELRKTVGNTHILHPPCSVGEQMQCHILLHRILSCIEFKIREELPEKSQAIASW